MDTLTSELFGEESWLTHLTVLLACILVGLVLRWAIFSVLRFYNKKNPSVLKEQLIEHLKRPAKFFVPLLLIYYSLFFYSELKSLGHRVIEVLLIMNLAWMLIAFLKVAEEVVKDKFGIDGQYIASERKVLTQLRFLKSIGTIVIITLAAASILWNIPGARQVGSTILTSAGIIGIIVGIAAQKSIANLVTGFQLAFTQTIKIDDEVVIEGEFGNVEDVTLTYVVIKTWDWRRLVLPLNYFNEKPFVNWTFNSRPLLASVHLHVDYTFPVNELRTKLMAILNDNPMWDKNIAEVEVIDTDNRDMTVRAAFSVRNATHSWKLRCLVREELIAFIEEEYPAALPKLRWMDAEEVLK